MIISASRRSDIPSFYAAWFVNRLKEGYALVPNPRNPHRLGRVSLSPDQVDCIVFWTKNPLPMFEYLDVIERMGYQYYFECTLTPYDRQIERNLPPKSTLIETFCRLSDRIGPDRVDWRYDPVLLGENFPLEYHLEHFEKMCAALHTRTTRCIFSFADPYRHVKGLHALHDAAMLRVAEGFARIASLFKLPLFTCAENIALEQYGIGHTACIDKKKIESILATPLEAKKDSGQRAACGCIASVDIGAYDTCTHGCSYCYATTSEENLARRVQAHNPHSPLLTGIPRGDEVISERTTPSQKIRQMSLFSC